MTYQAGTFRKLEWGEREAFLGDDSERAFERWFPFPVAPFGFRRPPFPISRLPLRLRYCPDYVCEYGLIEVMVVGRDQNLRLKTEKLEAMNLWQQDVATSLFIWNWLKELGTLIAVPQLTDQMTLAELGMFPEGKPYRIIDVGKLSAQWTPPGQTSPPSSTTRFTGTPTATAPVVGR